MDDFIRINKGLRTSTCTAVIQLAQTLDILRDILSNNIAEEEFIPLLSDADGVAEESGEYDEDEENEDELGGQEADDEPGSRFENPNA